MKYSGHCSYVKEYKNCWTMSIQFTKCLKAHLKVCLYYYMYIQSLMSLIIYSMFVHNQSQLVSLSLIHFYLKKEKVMNSY